MKFDLDMSGVYVSIIPMIFITLIIIIGYFILARILRIQRQAHVFAGGIIAIVCFLIWINYFFKFAFM
jgi:hypothetical protein